MKEGQLGGLESLWAEGDEAWKREKRTREYEGILIYVGPLGTPTWATGRVEVLPPNNLNLWLRRQQSRSAGSRALRNINTHLPLQPHKRPETATNAGSSPPQ